MSIKVGFIGSCFSKNQLDSLIEKKIIGDIPASVLGWKFVEGLVENGFETYVINELKLAPYRRSHCVYKRGWHFNENNVDVFTYFSLNFKILYHLIKSFFISRTLKIIKPDVVIVYSLHTPYLKAAVKYAEHNNKKVICIVPDLPNNMFGNYTKITKWLKKLDMRRINKLTKKIDGFVLLTSYMSEKISMEKSSEYIVIEGIADKFENIHKRKIEQEEPFDYILYTGSLSEKYGIIDFIEAYEKANLKSELWLCGTGNCVGKILEKCKNNKKIKYLGLKPRNEVIELQKKASLLVNPRNAEDEYTKYSFPSKTIEYLDSGTPLMMDRLLGIPEEYYNYIVKIENGWVNSLINYYSYSVEERKHIGEKGHQFIRDKKNIFIQGKKMKNFIMKIWDKRG